MGIKDSEIEKFETEVIESWLEDIDLTETIQGKALVEKGVEKGVAQGANQEAVRIANRMISAGKSNAEISELTGLSEETIQSIRKES